MQLIPSIIPDLKKSVFFAVFNTREKNRTHQRNGAKGRSLGTVTVDLINESTRFSVENSVFNI